MALADILKRIEDDAEAEAAEVVETAREQGEAMLRRARDEAGAVAAGIAEEAEARAERDRETVLANARLAARDTTLDAKQELAGRVLRRVREALTELPDGDYAALIARRIAESARGGEKVLIAKADTARLSSSLRATVDAEMGKAGREVALEYPGDDAGIDNGVMLVGERMSVEISPAALVAARREELLGRVSEALFGERAE